MRVAVVVRSLKIGGMERVAVSLSEAFASCGHDAHLVYFKNKKNAISPNSSVTLHHFNLDRLMLLSVAGFFYEIAARFLNIFVRKSYPTLKGAFTSQIFKIKLHLLEKKHGKIDLIIVRGQGTLEMIYDFRDDRVVAVLENIFSYGTINPYLKNRQIKLLYKDRNLAAVSDGVKDNFQKLQKVEDFECKKLHKITNPLNLEEISRLSTISKPDIESRYIISVGRIVKAKNLPLLLNAYSFARQKFGIDHLLVVVGDGSELKSIKNLSAELGIEKWVFFTGELSNPHTWMRGADLFVLSSKFEGLGMVLLEALASGTKVIATDSEGGVREIMKGRLERYLVEQDIEALGAKIAQVLAEDDEDFSECLVDFLPQTIVKNYLCSFTSYPCK